MTLVQKLAAGMPVVSRIQSGLPQRLVVWDGTVADRLINQALFDVSGYIRDAINQLRQQPETSESETALYALHDAMREIAGLVA